MQLAAKCVSVFVLASTLIAADKTSAPTQAPTIDKQKLENYLRYAEAFTPSVKVTIDDPTPAPVTGYLRLLVHLSVGEQKMDSTYYVTPDGQQIIKGTIWDINKSPFNETAKDLPKDGISFGPADAKVTIVVFSDFQCPYCREFAKTVRENVPSKYPTQVRVIYKDFPLESIHKWARAGAEAAHCLGDGNDKVYWDFHDWVFAHQNEITEANLHQKVLDFVAGNEPSLDKAKISACMENHTTAGEVEKSLEEGEALQIQQTPTVFVGGRLVAGAIPWASLDTLIQMELDRSKETSGPTVTK